MTRLQDLLERAGEVESVSFDSETVRVAAERRRARNRGAIVLGAVALVVVVAGWGILAGQNEGTADVATGPLAGGVELVGRWDLLAVSEMRVVHEQGVFIDFDSDGSLRGFDGCNGFSTTWSVTGDRLEVGPSVESEGEQCQPPSDLRLVELLESGPRISRFSGEEDTLQLTTADRFVAFSRASNDGDPGPGDDPPHDGVPAENPGDQAEAESTAFDFLQALYSGDWDLAARYLESPGGSPVEFGADIGDSHYEGTEIGRLIRLEPALADARDLPGLIEAWCDRHGGICTAPLEATSVSYLFEGRRDQMVEVRVESPTGGPPLTLGVPVGWFEGEWNVRDLPTMPFSPDRPPDVSGAVGLADGSPVLTEASDAYYLGMALAGGSPAVVRAVDGYRTSVFDLRDGDQVDVWIQGGCRLSSPVQCDIDTIAVTSTRS